MRLPRIAWNAPVCFGESAPGVRCEHNGESRVYCIRGFWGYRHQIEELIGNRTPENKVSLVRRHKVPGSLCFLTDQTIEDFLEIEKMLGELAGSFKAPPLDSTALLDTLWDNNKRPAMLVVLGHLNSKIENEEPLGPRIPLPSTNPRDWLLSRNAAVPFLSGVRIVKKIMFEGALLDTVSCRVRLDRTGVIHRGSNSQSSWGRKLKNNCALLAGSRWIYPSCRSRRPLLSTASRLQNPRQVREGCYQEKCNHPVFKHLALVRGLRQVLRAESAFECNAHQFPPRNATICRASLD